MLVHRRFTQWVETGAHDGLLVERGTVRVKYLTQEHNIMSPARARTRNSPSGVEHTNHETHEQTTLVQVAIQRKLLSKLTIKTKDLHGCRLLKKIEVRGCGRVSPYVHKISQSRCHSGIYHSCIHHKKEISQNMSRWCKDAKKHNKVHKQSKYVVRVRRKSDFVLRYLLSFEKRLYERYITSAGEKQR